MIIEMLSSESVDIRKRAIPSAPLVDITEVDLARVLKGLHSIHDDARESLDTMTLDDGLGCFRGIAAVLVCDLVLLGLGSLGWGLWHLLR